MRSWSNEWSDLYCGDALALLRTMPERSVHCIVTSPPYWGLRDYQIDGQLGLERTPEEYVARMVEVFREVRRVLRDDGTLWLNLGDSYAANRSYQVPSTKGGPKHSPAQGNSTNNHVPDGLKPKDLVGIPWRLAFALQADGAASPQGMRAVGGLISAITASYDTRDEWPDRIRQEVERLEREWEDAHRGGWWLRSDIIWAKPNPMPESVTDRPTKSHEYLFLLTKSARYFFDAEAVKERSTGQTGAAADFSRATKDHVIPGQTVAQHRLDRVAREDNGFRNRRTVWTIATQPYKGAHFATFPQKLVEPCILAGTSERGACSACGAPWERVVERTPAVVMSPASEYGHGAGRNDGGRSQLVGAVATTTGWRPTCACGQPDTVPCVVLDPFAGAGTVLLVAQQFGRYAVGLELNPKYCEMAATRCGMTENA